MDAKHKPRIVPSNSMNHVPSISGLLGSPANEELHSKSTSPGVLLWLYGSAARLQKGSLGWSEKSPYGS